MTGSKISSDSKLNFGLPILAPLTVAPPPVENDAQRILREARELLGPNGENWIKGAGARKKDFFQISDSTSTEECGFCAGGAVRVKLGFRIPGIASGWNWGVADKNYAALQALNAAAEKRCTGRNSQVGHYAFFNDSASTSFADIKELFAEAYELAGTMGSVNDALLQDSNPSSVV